MTKIKIEAIIHIYLYLNWLTVKIFLSICFHLESIASLSAVWLSFISSFFNLFLLSLLLEDDGDMITRYFRIISADITDVAPTKKKNKCSSIICPARETSVDSNIDG
jgi:hypothetical protein